jgi:hypothetical protein
MRHCINRVKGGSRVCQSLFVHCLLLAGGPTKAGQSQPTGSQTPHSRLGPKCALHMCASSMLPRLEHAFNDCFLLP